MNSAELRNRIFTKYSTNLRLLQQKYPDIKTGFKNDDGKIVYLKNEEVYICPICLRGFLRDSLIINNDQNHLTLEHIPPDSLHGKPRILTCKECNSRSGHNLDSALLKYKKTKDVLSLKEGASVEQVRFSFNESNFVSSNLTVLNKNPNKIFIQLKGESLRYIKEIIERKDEERIDYTINISFRFPAPEIISLALLRIGYLLFFRFFGYAILLSDNILKVIAQINVPSKTILPEHLGVIKFSPDQNIKNGVHILSHPKEYKSYIVVFELRHKNNAERFGVFIPGLGNEGWESYLSIESLNENCNFTFNKIKDVNFITKPYKINGYFTLWKYFEDK